VFNESEIILKLVQAFYEWKKSGGPTSLPISETVRILQPKNPSITEEDIRSMVESHNNMLKIVGDDISLSDQAESMFK
jgi:hypothetical protein